MTENFDINNFEYVDFHTHMHDKSFDLDSEQVMQNIIDKKILCVTVGTDIVESRNAKALSDKYIKNIFYTVGVHPHDDLSATFDESNQKDFEDLIYELDADNNKLKNKNCIAIGECGLDYFYLKGDREKGLIDNIDRDINRQREMFISQIKFATSYNLPLMIHGRCSDVDPVDNPTGMDAYEDIIEILEKFYKKESEEVKNNIQENKTVQKINGNIHFFNGNIEIAQKFMDLGFTFSFGGVLTLTRDYDEVVKYIPIEYIHAETDSPYVTPKDKEGNKIILNKNYKYRNSSENIDVIVEKIAEIKNLELESVKEKLKKNFLTFISK